MSVSVVRDMPIMSRVRVAVFTQEVGDSALYTAVMDAVGRLLDEIAPLSETKFKVSIPQKLREAEPEDFVSLILRTDSGNIVDKVHVYGYRVAEE